jgi:hypothetical protein
MRAQTKASELWETNQRLARIESLRLVALDYSYPAGQAQVGIQMATVEVPWLLAEHARLKAEIERLILNGGSQETAQGLVA